MRIAIHASDLDHDRIDGTRVYLLNMLRYFRNLDEEDEFFIYHQNEFNSHLEPPLHSNYKIKKLPFPFIWTQTRFAFEVLKDKPDVLWMPVHNLPLLRRKKLKTVATIHDLAFKIFPGYFPKKDLLKLNRLADLTIKNATHLIAVSQATKNDILKFYPQISQDKISVVHHGFDKELFEKRVLNDQALQILESYNMKAKNYLLYVGAIQPRKNLIVLIEAFEKLKPEYPDLKLVLAGAPAWQYESTLAKIESSSYKQDIIVTGTIVFEKLPTLYQNAAAFVFPSLYEGFGIPVLEAMASGAPVICANNSSLPEVAGDAALFFETENSDDLKNQIEQVLTNSEIRSQLIAKGHDRIKNYSWQKCAQQTLKLFFE